MIAFICAIQQILSCRSFTEINSNNLIQNTGTNEVSGTSEFLPLEPPVRVTGAGKSSLERNHTKLIRLHIFQGRDLGDGLK